MKAQQDRRLRGVKRDVSYLLGNKSFCTRPSTDTQCEPSEAPLRGSETLRTAVTRQNLQELLCGATTRPR